jgi:hypothetical protein
MSAMKPVWIDYWGLIPMTRRGYLIALAVAAIVAATLLFLLALLGTLPPLRTLWQEVPVPAQPFWQYWFYNNLYRIMVLCLIAQALDTLVVLRRFVKKEAQQRAEEAAAIQSAAQTEKANAQSPL